MSTLRRLILVSLAVLFLFPFVTNALTDEESMLEQARHHFSDGNYYYASTWLERILKTYPATPHREEVLLLISKAYASTGRDERAAQAVRILLKEYPKAIGSLDPNLLKLVGQGQPPESASPAPAVPSATDKPARNTAAVHPVIEPEVAPAPSVPKVQKVPEPAEPPLVPAPPPVNVPSPAPTESTVKTVAPPPVIEPEVTPAPSVPKVQKVPEPAEPPLVPAPPPVNVPSPAPTESTVKTVAPPPVIEPEVTPAPSVPKVQKVPEPAEPPLVPAPPPVNVPSPAPTESTVKTVAPPPVIEPEVTPAPSVPKVQKVPEPAEPPLVPSQPHVAEPTSTSPELMGETATLPATAEPEARDGNKSKMAGMPDNAAETVMYTLEIGEYIVKSAMADAKRKIKIIGLSPVVKQGPKRKIPMIRLYFGDFLTLEAARKEENNLLAAKADSFILMGKDRRFHVYAGSYNDQNGAKKEQQRLAALGIILSLKKIIVPVPTFLLTAGSFPTLKAALEKAEELKKQGVIAVVVQRPTR